MVVLRWQDLGRQVALGNHRSPQQIAGVDSVGHLVGDRAARAICADRHVGLIAVAADYLCPTVAGVHDLRAAAAPSPSTA